MALGYGKLVAAVVEQCHDKAGIIWPKAVAPFDIYLIAVNQDDPEVVQSAKRLYDLLKQQGYDVLYDDREQRPGFKFKDADLIGVPLRLVVSSKLLKDNKVELKVRASSDVYPVGPDELLTKNKRGDGMSSDFMNIIECLEKDKGIQKDVLLEAVTTAIESVARKSLELEEEVDVQVSIDPITGSIDVAVEGQPVEAEKLGRIAAQTAKQVIMQKMKEAETDVLFDSYKDKVGELINKGDSAF